jgi:hypothetical protein
MLSFLLSEELKLPLSLQIQHLHSLFFIIYKGTFFFFLFLFFLLLSQKNLLGFTLIECINDNYRKNVDEQLNHVVERLRSKFVSYTEEDMHHFLMNIPIGEGFFFATLYR